MNSRDTNNFIKGLKKHAFPQLTPKEKELLRASFLSQAGIITTPPVKKPVETTYAIPSPYLSKLRKFALPVALCVGFTLSGASVMFAAERALPGDLLYPIKTRVNENILRIFNRTKQTAQQEQFEIGLVDERLSEAEQLAQKETLNATQKGAITKGVEGQLVRAMRLIDKNEAPRRHGAQTMSHKEAGRDTEEKPGAIAAKHTSTQNENDHPAHPAQQPPATNITARAPARGGGHEASLPTKTATQKPDRPERQNQREAIAGEPDNGEKRLNAVLEKHEDIIQKLDPEKSAKNDRK